MYYKFLNGIILYSSINYLSNININELSMNLADNEVYLSYVRKHYDGGAALGAAAYRVQQSPHPAGAYGKCLVSGYMNCLLACAISANSRPKKLASNN